MDSVYHLDTVFISLTLCQPNPFTSWKRGVNVLRTVLMSMFSFKFSYVFMYRMCWSW